MENFRHWLDTLVRNPTVPRYYIAHPVNAFLPRIEDPFIRFIAGSLSEDFLLENPSQLYHQLAYAAWKERVKNRDGHIAMNYYFDVVLPDCDGTIAIPFLDGKFGFGIGGEIRWFLEGELPVLIAAVTEKPTLENFEAFLKNPTNGFFTLRETTEEEKDLFVLEGRKEYPDQDRKLVMGHEATRVRTFAERYNGALRPYELAHLSPLTAPPGFYDKT